MTATIGPFDLAGRESTSCCDVAHDCALCLCAPVLGARAIPPGVIPLRCALAPRFCPLALNCGDCACGVGVPACRCSGGTVTAAPVRAQLSIASANCVED